MIHLSAPSCWVRRRFYKKICGRCCLRSVFIVGPTASGKSGAALSLCGSGVFSGIVNADASQAYRQVSVGVAKPSLEEVSTFNHYLFDVADCVPHSLNASLYRSHVDKLVANVLSHDERTPLFVGGTLFYVKSLFFKLREVEVQAVLAPAHRPEGISDWEYLQSIDPERAHALHPNDAYRITRALEIYTSTGCKPSQAQPSYEPVFDQSLIIWISLPDQVLKNNIFRRASVMLEHGWIEEVESLMGTPWETFAKDGCALGYDDVYVWIKNGKKQDALSELEETIAYKTWHYARRQRIFWRSLRKALMGRLGVTVIECSPEGVGDVVFGWLNQKK
jgi:tRNA dimethylallyltransferase